MKYCQKNIYILSLVLIPLLIVLSFIFPLSLFEMGEEDGFFSQINSVSDGVGDENKLGFIHYLRYLSIYPILYVENNMSDGKVINTFVLCFLFFLSFVYFSKSKNKIKVLGLIILIIPLVFSIRASLAMLSMFMLYFFFVGVFRSKILIAVGFFFSILSSGTVLNYIFVLITDLIKGDYKFKTKIVIALMFFFVFLLFLPSLYHKIAFFSSGAGITEFFINMISRANLPTALESGRFYVFGFYLFICALGLIGLYRSHYKDKMFVFIFIVSLVLFEGLGSMSLIPLILLLSIYKINFNFLTKPKVHEQ